MIYDVSHLTRYQYDAPVAVNVCVLRLLPRSEDGQRVLDANVEVTPRPLTLAERADAFGNRVLNLRIETPHRELTLHSRARVVVERPTPPLAALTPAWEDVAALAASAASLDADSPAAAIYPSRLAPLFAAATDYARVSFPPRRPIYEGAIELARRIKADFAYESGATEVTTSPVEAFARKRGVCQDFAHVMIAGLRGLGLPALYVSGYIRTIPPPGKPRLAGADASHAWTSRLVRPRLRLARPRSDQRDRRRRRPHLRRARPRLFRRAAGGRADRVVGRARARGRGRRHSSLRLRERVSPEPNVAEADIRAAYAVIAPYVRRTPLIEAASPIAGAPPISLKLEFLQHAGSFKPRGAFHNLLTRAAPPVGCATASGGNHGAAVAYAAAKLGVRARVFVPEIAAPPKIAKIKAYGAEVVVRGRRLRRRAGFVRRLCRGERRAGDPPLRDRGDGRRPGDGRAGMGRGSRPSRPAADRHGAGRGRRRRPRSPASPPGSMDG